MKILLIGGNTKIGQAIRQVFAFDDLIVVEPGQFDITNVSKVRTGLQALKPNVVINCNTRDDYEEAQTQPAMSELYNFHAIALLAKECYMANASLLQFSSEMVFGNVHPDKHGIDENCIPMMPMNRFGTHLLQGEHAIQECMTNYWIVRTSWVFGPGGNSDFVQRSVEKLRQGKPAPAYEDIFACPTYSFDLARAVRKLISDRSPFGFYHLVNSGPATEVEVATEIIDYVKGGLLRVQHLESYRVQRPKMGILINSKRPRLRPWTQALEEFLFGTGVLNQKDY